MRNFSCVLRCSPALLALAVVACGDDNGAETLPNPDAHTDADTGTADVPGDASVEVDAMDDVTEPSDTDMDVSVDSDGSGVAIEWVTAPGIAAEGCPIGGAYATEISSDEFRVDGPDALGGPTDFLMINDQAAFVIQGIENHKTYWYYGGTPMDAVALDGCAQLHPDNFGELGFIAGVPRLSTFTDSILRGVRADSIEVISDGRDGSEARVRVRGTDDYFWLIELELIKQGFEGGSPRPMSEPMGLDITIDWVLRPGSRVLEAEVAYTNTLDTANTVIMGMVQFAADATRTVYHFDSQLSIAGFTADLGIPWLVTTNDQGAWGLAFEDWNLATTNIAGTDALINADTFLAPIVLTPAGTEGDTLNQRFFLSVGPSDAHSAARNFADVLTNPIPGVEVARVPVDIVVTEDGTAEPVAGARVQLQALGGQNWSVLDEFITDEGGRVRTDAVRLNATRRYRWVVAENARTAQEPVVWDGETEEVALTAGRRAQVNWSIVNDDGAAMPGKVVFWQDGRMVARFFATGEAETGYLPPGTYDVDVSRGFEYLIDRQTVTVSAEQPTDLSFTLSRAFDTTGYLAMDQHVHGGPSPDSPIRVPHRILTLAAEGIEVAVSTDHEALIDWAPGVDESGLGDWVATVLGEEVTPPLPEHHNAYPFVPDPLTVRGTPPDWRGLDVVGLHETIRDRGAEVVALNHPRLGCGYMCLVGYDRLTGEATLEDPTLLGFAPTAELWSWNFDTVEYQNSNREVFVDPEQPERTGLFEDWMSFQNLGYRVTAVGVTDVHGEDAQGSPRNYFVAPTDEPASFTDDMLVDAIKAGRSLVSTGAFARVTLNGVASMGDTVTDDDGTVNLQVRIEALPEIDVTHFTVFANCDEVGTFATTDPGGVLKFDGEVEVTIDADSHIVVLGFGRELLPRNLPQFSPDGVPRFTTNPIFVDADGDAEFTAPGGKTCEYSLEVPNEGDALILPPRTAWLQRMLPWWQDYRVSLVEDSALNYGSTCICSPSEHEHHH